MSILNLGLLKGALFALGSAGGVPLLLLGEFGQVSNPAKRILKITTGGPKRNDYKEIDVCFDNEESVSEWKCRREEKMRLLNVKTGEWTGSNSMFELAVKERTNVTSLGNPSIFSGLVSLVYCYGENGKDDARTGKCKDISGKWYYGIVMTDNYEFTFAIKKKDANKFIFGNEHVEWVKWGQNDSKVINLIEEGKLYKAMSLNGRIGWSEWARGVNDASKDYDAMRVGFKFSKWEDRKEEHRCNNKAIGNFLDSCSWSLIDVSRYTLTKEGRGPIWSTKFTPTITWELVK